MKHLILRFFVLIFSISVSAQCTYKQLSAEMLEVLERVMCDIYHLTTEDIEGIVHQDFGSIPLISAKELKSKMDENPQLLVINVLSEKWYNDCHISGSINVPLDKLINLMEQYDRSQEVVVYCALDECDASEKAYVLLRCMDFEHVFDYRGGIKEWFQFGYPVIGDCVSSYLHDRTQNRFEGSECVFDFDFCALIKKSYKYNK